MTSWSFESGGVEEGNIENMQGSGSWGLELRNIVLNSSLVCMAWHMHWMVEAGEQAELMSWLYPSVQEEQH